MSKTDRDHVRRQRAADAVVSIVERAFAPPPRRRDLVCRHARSQLQHLREGDAVAEQPPRLVDPPPRTVARDGGADLLLHDSPCLAQLTQAVEVGEPRHVGVRPGSADSGRRRPRAKRPSPISASSTRRISTSGFALRGIVDVEALSTLRRAGVSDGNTMRAKKRVAPIRRRRRERLRGRPREQRLDRVVRPARRGGRGDDLRLDRSPSTSQPGELAEWHGPSTT